MNGSTNRDYEFFRFESARLNSFVDWPCSYVEPKILAAAGFYYTGPADAVKCFDCSTRLHRWEENDDPWVMHQRFAGRCRFIHRAPCGNVPIDSELIPSSLPRSRDYCGVYGHTKENSRLVSTTVVFEECLDRDECGILKRPVNVYFDATEQPKTVDFSILQNAKYPEYAYAKDRLATFATWPTDKMQTKSDLVAAGLYYTGSDDTAVCYYCGGGLTGWEPTDVPRLEPLKWFPRCAFIQSTSGAIANAPSSSLTTTTENHRSTIVHVR